MAPGSGNVSADTLGSPACARDSVEQVGEALAFAVDHVQPAGLDRIVLGSPEGVHVPLITVKGWWRVHVLIRRTSAVFDVGVSRGESEGSRIFDSGCAHGRSSTKITIVSGSTRTHQPGNGIAENQDRLATYLRPYGS